MVDKTVQAKNREKRERSHLEVMRQIVWWLFEAGLVRCERFYIFVHLLMFSRHGVADASEPR